jgi:hypothetical protein
VKPWLERTDDGQHFSVRDIVLEVTEVGPVGNISGIPHDLHRFFHLDTGKEVYRADGASLFSCHMPGDGKKIVHLSRRDNFALFDVFCWEIP